jgi:hypothetical protein
LLVVVVLSVVVVYARGGGRFALASHTLESASVLARPTTISNRRK